MTGQKLHIVSFDVPSPADYGGVIDVFYKIKALSEAGVKITLHCFKYGRLEAPELKEYCEKVFYYSRGKGFSYMLKKTPYIVSTRNSPQLLKNLLADQVPILFEGLHTCFFLAHPEIANRKKIVRMHNIEHDYYSNLSKVEPGFAKRFYFRKEALKLKKFEQSLKFADILLTISPSDQDYFERIYHRSEIIPAFHQFEEVKSKSGLGEYFLFHGNLSVGENLKAINFLLDEVFNSLDFPLIIAGKNASPRLLKKAGNFSNVRIISNPSHQQMDDLIQNAQGCVIPTFQPTGLKLKLLASLFSGRFCITNSTMVSNTGLEELCIICDTAEKMKEAIKRYNKIEFSGNEKNKRKQILENNFSNKKNAKRLLKLIKN